MSEILVIREADAFTSILIENGFSVLNFPTIKTEVISDLTELENFIVQIDSFDGIFITSSKAAEIVLMKLNEAEKDFNGKFYVLGKRSHDLLNKLGYRIYFDKNAETAKTLLDSIPSEDLAGKKFLFPCSNRSLRVIPETLNGVAEVVETVVYKTVAVETSEEKLIEIKEKLKAKSFAAICFFSLSGAEEFLKKFGNFSQANIKIAAIGATTAHYVNTRNLRVNFVSDKPAARDFAQGLIEFLRKEI